MVKFIFVICVFLFLSGVQHGQADKTVNLTVGLIINTAYREVENLVDEFETSANFTFDTVNYVGKGLQKHLKNKIDRSLALLNEKFNSAIPETNPVCQILVNKFSSNMMGLYQSTCACVDNHITNGRWQVETVKNTANMILAKFNILREEERNCTKDMHIVLDHTSTRTCLTQVITEANETIGIQVPILSTQAFEVILELNSLIKNVTFCVEPETSDTIIHEFNTTMKQLLNCINASVTAPK